MKKFTRQAEINKLWKRLRGYFTNVVQQTRNAGIETVAKLNQGLGMDRDSAVSDANAAHNDAWTILDGGDISKLPKPNKMRAFRYAEGNNIELPTTKAYGDTLRALSNLPALLPQLQRFAIEDSVDSPQNKSAIPLVAGARALIAGSEAGKLTGVGQDLAAAQRNLQSTASQLAIINDPGARVLAGVLNAQKIVDPSQTVAQNQRNIDNFKARVSRAMDDNLFSGMPKEYGTAIKAHKGLLAFDESNNPTAVPQNTSPNVNPTGGATPPNKQHPTVPGAIWDPVKSQQMGHDVWQVPPTPAIPSPSQSPNGAPVTNPQPQVQ